MVKKRTKKGNDVASESLATQDVKAFPAAHRDARSHGRSLVPLRHRRVHCRQCRQ